VQQDHAVEEGGLYRWMTEHSLEEIAHQTALYALAYYPPIIRAGSIRAPLVRAQRNTAGILYRFFRDVQAGK